MILDHLAICQRNTLQGNKLRCSLLYCSAFKPVVFQKQSRHTTLMAGKPQLHPPVLHSLLTVSVPDYAATTILHRRSVRKNRWMESVLPYQMLLFLRTASIIAFRHDLLPGIALQKAVRFFFCPPKFRRSTSS